MTGHEYLQNIALPIQSIHVLMKVGLWTDFNKSICPADKQIATV